MIYSSPEAIKRLERRTRWKQRLELIAAFVVVFVCLVALGVTLDRV